MMYVSDHGESLGGYGLYLHGTPFPIAPDAQKKIPFLLWMSEAFMTTKNLSVEDFQQQATHSHHHIFHSVMGALSIDSDVYKEELDIFEEAK
jgi:lipid A ethanolaminephosphotransferase